jgi:hypothetical protein
MCRTSVKLALASSGAVNLTIVSSIAIIREANQAALNSVAYQGGQ